MKIGVLVESFRKPFADSLKEAARLGIQGLQIYAKDGPVYDKMPVNEINELKKIIAGEGLEVSALCGDFGCRMFYYPHEMRDEIEREKRVLALAKELGTNIVTTHIGVVPENFATKDFDNMYSVCKELADFADSIDGFFAVETGPEPSGRLKNFLDTLGSRGVGVNLDPANLAMVIGEDAAEAVYNLRDYIVHTHAKDGRMIKPGDPRKLYVPAIAHVDPQAWSDYIIELPLGDGEVRWEKYLNALNDIGYNGYLTIEREVGDHPAQDISKAVDFLRKVAAPYLK